MKAVDLTGQRFGQLVVTGRAGSSAAGNATWWCLCDCGNTTRSAGSDLRSGDTATCGCGTLAAARQYFQGVRDQLVGKTFGRLTVVGTSLNDYPRAVAECECACGNRVTVEAHKLPDGARVSCGCAKSAARPGARRGTGYVSAHYRVKFLHGSASTHGCADCGNSATDWSYNHTDPGEFTDERGRPYSLDPTYYAARCRSCHKVFDLAAIAAGNKNKKEKVS